MLESGEVGRGSGVERDLGVGLGLGVGGGVGVPNGGVGVGVHGGPTPRHQVMFTVSTRQPSLPPLVSLAIRQRSLPHGCIGGTFTTVVMKPPEFPLQA